MRFIVCKFSIVLILFNDIKSGKWFVNGILSVKVLYAILKIVIVENVLE